MADNMKEIEEKNMSHEVLAVVAGEEITQAEFDAFLQGVPREQQPYLSNPQFREQCLEQLIALHMFAKNGELRQAMRSRSSATLRITVPCALRR